MQFWDHIVDLEIPLLETRYIHQGPKPELLHLRLVSTGFWCKRIACEVDGYNQSDRWGIIIHPECCALQIGCLQHQIVWCCPRYCWKPMIATSGLRTTDHLVEKYRSLNESVARPV